MLLHIPQVLEPSQVERMRQRLEAAPWVDGRETVGAQGAQVKRNRQLPDASPLRRELGAEVLAALAGNALFHAAVLPAQTMPPRFNHLMRPPALPGEGTVALVRRVRCGCCARR